MSRDTFRNNDSQGETWTTLRVPCPCFTISYNFSHLWLLFITHWTRIQILLWMVITSHIWKLRSTRCIVTTVVDLGSSDFRSDHKIWKVNHQMRNQGRKIYWQHKRKLYGKDLNKKKKAAAKFYKNKKREQSFTNSK